MCLIGNQSRNASKERHESIHVRRIPEGPRRELHWLQAALGLAAAVLFLIAAIPAQAQVDDAALRGVVSSAEGPRGGLAVIAENVATGQVRRATTRDDGSYVLAGLSPGTYNVRVGADDAGEGETITLRVGQTAGLDFEIGAPPDVPPEQAALEGVVVLGAQAAPLETSEIGTSITPRQIEVLPQINRNFLAFADLAPGVQFVQRADGSATVRGGVQHQRNVNVFIDGVSQKDYVLKGGITGQDTSRGNPFPQSAIAEYKIITQNYKAEYPHLGSAAITAVTASGTNDFQASAFIDRTDESLRASTPSEITSGEEIDSQQEQYGVDVSGPIVEDTLHYLFAFEAKDNEDPVEVVPGAGFTAETLPDEFAALVGTAPSVFKEDLFFGKVDWYLDHANEFSASLKYRDETSEQGIGNINAPSFGGSVDQEETRFQLKYAHFADRWQNEVRVTYEDVLWSPNPLTSGIGRHLQDSTMAGILNVGAGANFQRKGQDGWGIQNDFTLLDLEWLGTHTIKTGLSYKDLTLSTLQMLPANPQYFFNVEFNGPGTFELVQPYKLELGVPLTAASGTVDADNSQYGFYIQDDWFVTDRLTLNLGVRYDYEDTPIYTDRRTPAAVANALRTWPNINNDTVNYDIENWISNTDNRENDADNISPRFGFSYDLGDDFRHTLYGGAGRSYDRNQFDFLSLEAIQGTFGRVSFFFQGDPDNSCSGTNCVPWDPIYLTQEGRDQLVAMGGEMPPTEIFLLNNDLETPYTDQFSVGIRSSWGDWDTDVTLSRVESKNGFNWLLGNRRDDGTFFEPGAISGSPFGITPPGFSNLLLSSNDLETEANSLFVKVSRPHLDNWSVAFAYTFTDGEENRSFDGTFALDYPTIEGYGIQDSVDIAKHRLVATGSYDLPWNMTFASKITWDSGVTKQFRGCLAGDDQCMFGRTVPDDADFKQVDISLSKTFNFGFLPAGGGFWARIDVINLFNTRNWDAFDLFPGDINGVNANFGNHQQSVSMMRTAKLSFGVDF